MKKILSFIFTICFTLSTCFMFLACDNNSVSEQMKLRVQDGYIQWSEDNTNWYNLITVEDVLDSIGDDIKGEQGVAGKQVEFNSSSTHIQWRYVGDAAWKNLIAFDALEQKDEVVNEEELYSRGFELFQSKLNNMNSNYKVTYEYADNYVVESFLNYSVYIPRLIDGSEKLWHTNLLNMRVSMEYDYPSVTSLPSQNIESFKPYCLNVIGESTADKEATFGYVGNCKYIADIKEYKFMFNGGTMPYSANSNVLNENFDYKFVSNLKKFKLSNVIDVEFNEHGDCVLTCNYDDTYSSYYPYLSSEYIYDFCITAEGELVNCYVYEKDFLNSEVKGDLYCKISYKKGESLIDSDLLDLAFEKHNEWLAEEYPDKVCEDWFDVFCYVDVD